VRILVLSNLYPPYTIGGYEQACRDTVEDLRDRGHHVEVLTSAYGLQRPTSADGIHRLLRLDPFWLPERVRDGLPALFAHNVSGYKTLKRLLRSVRPDVVYVWNMAGLTISLLTGAQRAALPIVLNIQDKWLLDMRRDPWFAAWTYQSRSTARAALKAMLRVLVDPLVPTRLPALRSESAQYVSAAFAALHTWHGWSFARERVIYNGIDTQVFAATRRELIMRPYKLLFVGQLAPGKGAHTAIEAVAILVRQLGRDAVTLTIVGGGHDTVYQQRVHWLAHASALEDIVRFVGPVARPDTAALYADHDVLLFPSSWIEGFSLVLLEALASALPVVGTTTGGSAEILEDGRTGLVVPPDDVMALARQVARLIDDPRLAQRLGETGAAVVRQRFDRRHVIDEVEGYLSEAVSMARAGRAGW